MRACPARVCACACAPWPASRVVAALASFWAARDGFFAAGRIRLRMRAFSAHMAAMHIQRVYRGHESRKATGKPRPRWSVLPSPMVGGAAALVVPPAAPVVVLAPVLALAPAGADAAAPGPEPAEPSTAQPMVVGEGGGLGAEGAPPDDDHLLISRIVPGAQGGRPRCVLHFRGPCYVLCLGYLDWCDPARRLPWPTARACAGGGSAPARLLPLCMRSAATSPPPPARPRSTHTAGVPCAWQCYLRTAVCLHVIVLLGQSLAQEHGPSAVAVHEHDACQEGRRGGPGQGGPRSAGGAAPQDRGSQRGAIWPACLHPCGCADCVFTKAMWRLFVVQVLAAS